MSDKCDDCKYTFPLEYLDEYGDVTYDHLECRKYPPLGVVDLQMIFPILESGDKCGKSCQDYC